MCVDINVYTCILSMIKLITYILMMKNSVHKLVWHLMQGVYGQKRLQKNGWDGKRYDFTYYTHYGIP